MAWRNSCPDAANSKPSFLTVYATVIVGVILSFVYVFSAIYSSNPPHATLSLSTGENFNLAAPNTSSSSDPATVSVSPHRPLQLSKPIWELPSRTQGMPPLESFHLTKELVEERVKDNIIIVTFGNFAFMDFILTWVKHLTDLGLSNLLVGAMDTKLLEALYWKGIPVFDIGSHMSTVDVGWGSPTFHKMEEKRLS